MGGISIWQLVIVLAIVLVVFGTKRFKNIGSDLGGAIKGFKKSMNSETPKNAKKENISENIIDGETVNEAKQEADIKDSK